MVELISACALVVTLTQPGVRSEIRRLTDTSDTAIATATVTAPVTAPVTATRRSPTLIAMYASFATLQALDVHSTMTALSHGGVEANPAMRGIVGNTGSLIGVKAVAGVTTIWVTEKLRKRHPRGAIVLMAALNSAMTTIVARNYSLR